MSKQLLIQYGDLVLFDGPVGQVKWAENDDGVVEVRAEPPGLKKAGGAADLMRALAEAGANRKTNGTTDEGNQP